MTIDELKVLFREHQLVEAIVEPYSDGGQWIVEFRHVQGGFILLTDSHGEECYYGNYDLASKSAMEVGFKHVKVDDFKI